MRGMRGLAILGEQGPKMQKLRAVHMEGAGSKGCLTGLLCQGTGITIRTHTVPLPYLHVMVADLKFPSSHAVKGCLGKSVLPPSMPPFVALRCSSTEAWKL